MVHAAAWDSDVDESRMAEWPESLGRVPAVERWGWTGDDRSVVPVEIYSNCDSVEVRLNGRSLGVRPIPDPLLPAILWAVPNEPGTVEVLGRRDGAEATRFQLKTVGPPSRLEMAPDLTTLRGGGRQVSTVEIRVLDADGNRVPDATLDLSVEVTGEGSLMALGTADLEDTTPVTSSRVRLYEGRAVAVVRSRAGPGRITIRAQAPGVAAAEVTIEVGR
jgi:beta-galactosidase